MASVVLRSVFGPSVLPSKRVGVASLARVGACSFASSSRVGLDFTRPLRAESPSTPSSSSASESGAQRISQASSPIDTEPIVNSAETPSTSGAADGADAADASTPTPTPASASASTSSSSSPAPRSSGSTKQPPRFNLASTPSFPTPPKPLPGFRWEPEPSMTNRLSSSPSVSRFDNFNLPIHDPFSPTHTLTITSTRNNVLLTFSDRIGPIFPTISGGSDKTFKKAGRASYEAANQAALKAFEKITGFFAHRPSGEPFGLRVAFRGVVGQGREAVAQALAGPQGEEMRKLIERVEDRTPVKIGGTRARKARRL